MLWNRTLRAATAAVVVAAMVLQPFAALAGSPETVAAPIKMTPAAVSSDTLQLPPDQAAAENAAAQLLFDNDTATAHAPAQPASVTVALGTPGSIDSMRLYGSASYLLNVFRDNSGAWEPVPSLSGKPLTGLTGNAWNTLIPDTPVSAQKLLLEFIPQGNVSAGVPEVEFWGTSPSLTPDDVPYATLANLKTPRQALDLLAKRLPHIFSAAATPTELAIPDGSTDDSSATAFFTLDRNPSLFKRAYLLYDGYNITRPVSIRKRINSGSWSGGYVLAQPAGSPPSWSSQIEEINPAWLAQGENRVEFSSPSGTAAVRNLTLVLEADSGWNAVDSVSAAAAYDGDPSTSFVIHASGNNPNLQVNFERTVEPRKMRLHVKGPANLAASLQFLSGGSWQEVKPGWKADLSGLRAGWNEIDLPAQVAADALRLVFETRSLRLKSGVQSGAVNEIRVAASPVGALSGDPRVVVSYPRDGEYFGRTAYLQGFATPAASDAGGVEVTVGGKGSPNADGAFSVSLSKDEAGYAEDPDDTAWSASLASSYGGGSGAVSTLTLDRNADSGAVAKAKVESKGKAGAALLGESRVKYSETVNPGKGKKIAHEGVELDIPEGAVETDTEITIIPLTQADLAKLDPGMVNVTSPAAGYRFLPHGMKFKKPIKISFGYGKHLLPVGQTPDDVGMYYYDESRLQWQPLTRVGVDHQNSKLVSESDHFTDIINTTLVVPEHPQALSFNPNSIKDIKAADPTAGIDLIEPPMGGPSGSANLSYPIEIPKGRGAYTPDLKVAYSSGNANGWMGLGWDIPVSKIQVDTRWGVPLYDPAQETESYLLDGAALAPHVPRPFAAPQERGKGDKAFYKRVEGDFLQIIRRRTSPAENDPGSAYYWEATDKNGVRYVYGQTSQGRLSSYLPGSANIFQWNLEKVVDIHGNQTEFFYDTDTGTNGEPFKQVYLARIVYTSHVGATGAKDKEGSYSVEFNRSTGRPDVIIDGKPGFQVLTRSRLDSVSVKYGNALVRQYLFSYIPEAEANQFHFGKSLLQKITHKGVNGAKDFYSHDFTYERMPQPSQGSNGYVAFEKQVKEWGGAGGKRLSETVDKSAGLAVSFGIAPPSNYPVFGFQGSYARGWTDTRGMFVDVNGDGLPDRIRSGGEVELNQLNPADAKRGSGSFSAASFPGTGALGASHNDNFSIGGQIGFWIGAANLAYSYNIVNGDKMISDVDGDGLIDLVDVSGGGFSVLKNTGARFTPTPWSGYTLAGVDLKDQAASDKLKGGFFLTDPVRKWIAPYKGTVHVTGAVQKVRAGGQDSPLDSADADGPKASVRAYIYHNGDASPAWSAAIKAVDTTAHSHDLAFTVSPGDRIYFRVNSVDDTEADAVYWQPKIDYQQVCVAPNGTELCHDVGAPDSALLDPLGHPLFSTDSGTDFRLSGYPGNVWKVGAKGKVTISGKLVKKKTSDDVAFAITLNKSAVLWSASATSDQEGTFTAELSGQEINEGDQVSFDISSDTVIDPSLVSWQPEIRYEDYCFARSATTPKEYDCGPVVCSPDATGKVVCNVEGVALPPEAQFEEKDVRYYGQVNYPFYYLTPTDPSRFWTAPEEGTVRVQGNVVRSATTGSFLAVARGVNRLLWKQAVPAGGPQALPDSQPSEAAASHEFSLKVAKGDQIFFDIQSATPIDRNALAWAPTITYTEHCSSGQCTPITQTSDQSGGTSMQYCETSDDRTVCHAMTCTGGSDPSTGTCNYCETTTLNNNPSHPQTSCQPISCADNPVSGQSCAPGSFVFQAPQATLRSYDQRFYDNTRPDAEAFGGGYRQWFYGEWNGNVAWDETRIKRSAEADIPTDTSTYQSDDYKRQPSYIFTYLTPRWQGNSYYSGAAWTGRGYGDLLGADQVAPSRLGANVDAIVSGRGINSIQHSVSHNTATGVSIGIGLSYSTGDSTSKLDFMDMNGDRFPDQVSGGAVLYNNGVNGFAYSLPTSLGNVRKIENNNISHQLGYCAPENQQSASGVTRKVMSRCASLGLAYGISDTDSELIDVNGDGLPDRVHRAGSDSFAIRMNLGYRFSAPIVWRTDSWNKGDLSLEPVVSANADRLQINENATYSAGASFWSIGGGASYTVARTLVALRDINGDGLPDQILKTGRDFSVKLNMGDHFGPTQVWEAPEWDHDVADGIIAELIPGNNDTISYSASDSYQLSAGVPILIPIIPVLTVLWIDTVITMNVSGGTGGSSLEFQDINGDGLPDHLLKLKGDDSVFVRLNNVGQTNLLKEVRRPLGGKFTLDYQRAGNTVDMPSSQWVLKKVVLSDGTGHSYTTDYKFYDGYYDRNERESYGFGRVEETQAPGTSLSRTVVQEFHNRDYYLKNLLEKSVTTDGRGNVWAKSANTYLATDVGAGSKFPQLRETNTYYYDGSGGENAPAKSSYQTFGYDSYGNVTAFFDAGELATAADDVSATIGYWRDPKQYVMKPDTIEVRDSGKKVLRKRWASYENGTGNLMSHTSLATGGQSPTWEFSYDPYGNIRTITDPAGYALTYGYDAETGSYVTRIQDNFSSRDGGPYYSTAGYDLRFGLPAWTKDLNGNYQVSKYDEFGRLASVFGPYDTDGSGNPLGLATLAFEYKAPVFAADGENLLTPAGAVTRNKASSRVGSVGNTVDTVLFADGMKRVLQTKKEADVNGAYGMTVSGPVVYDELGRTVEQGQPLFQGGGDLYGYLSQQLPKNPTHFGYDPLDRTVRVETPDAQGRSGYAVTTTTYGFGKTGSSGVLYATTKVVDPIGNAAGEANRKGTKISFKDVDERIAAVVEYNNGAPITTSYDYDPLGQITTVRDNKGNTTTVEYDLVGRRTAITNPDTGRTEYGYDANGNMTSKLTANYNRGKEIKYSYLFNRLTGINYPNSTGVAYEYGAMGAAYNRAGRITRVTDESGVEERFYGKLGETTREVKSVEAKTPSARRKSYTTDYVFDSFGRMLQMTYPDGENLYYAYDNGGLLKSAWGIKQGNRYNYINTLTYDEFGQRRHVDYGNGVNSEYTYDDFTRRLDTLTTATPEGRTVQNLSYGYDLVGNILRVQNAINTPTNTALPAGPLTQVFEYDDLYQLKTADGEYSFGPGKQNLYSNEFFYDTIGNFTRKSLVNRILQPSATATLPKETNYLLDYKYGGTHPHAVTDAGDKLYSYDPAGNMTGWTSKTNGKRRTIIWNEENRVKEIADNGKSTYFLYDDAGERVLKRGQHGETFYINRFYSIKNGELGTKSVYAGNTRVASKLVKTPNTATANTETSIPGIQGLDHGLGNKTGIIIRLPDGTSTGVLPPEEKDRYFYHGDHLGSSNMISDASGSVYQHLEYFPFGETWIDEGKTRANIPGYQFTGKELDPETGLYYFGARYYEPVISRWISADPILDKYLDGAVGGGYEPSNLALFSYSRNTPVVLKDPDGNVVPLLLQAYEATAVVTSGSAVVGGGYQATRLKNGVPPSAMAAPFKKLGGYLTGAWEGGKTLLQNPQQAIENLKENLGLSKQSSEKNPGQASPEIKPSDLDGKTRGEIRDFAKDQGLIPTGDKTSKDYPRKWKDPATGAERLRLDRGHTDPKTGKPYNDPRAAGDHSHGYEPNGAPIKDQTTGNKHFPTHGE